ncbi:hypothetical protein HNO86_22470 [Pseudomonas sp. C1C7]|uniref:hypothetical protein n=1 Tax=Pseudomonas sp. C1C7 TaxID=2735272 RepID=UPI0015865549|nr:hypothetical protein [Pseudomonas sp. C1C7]NUT77818.1 hypothetical protein [Pseudomonas sp. C1C7]
MEERVLKWKLVNFLVADVEVDFVSANDEYTEADIINLDVLGNVLESFRQRHGGLWVGGGLVITSRVVRLSANGLNRAVQSGALDIELPLPQIRRVTVEGGFITKIVRLDTRAGSVKFRCYGAKKVAALIGTLMSQRG